MALTSRRAALATLLVAATVAAAGCTSQKEPAPTGSTGATGGGGTAAASASPPPIGGTPSAYPVAPSASPTPLPSLGAARNADGTLTLTAVRRLSPSLVSVEGVLELNGTQNLGRYSEPGFAERISAGGKKESTWEFSGVTLTVAGDPKVYLAARTPDGACLCTQGVVYYRKGPVAVYTYVTAPQQATAVTVTVQGFAPFANIQVSS